MENKIPAVLISINKNSLNNAFFSLNLNKVNLIAILSDEFGNNPVQLSIDNKMIPIYPIANIQKFINDKTKFLLSGVKSSVVELWKMKKFLIKSGIPSENIINFYVMEHITNEWIGNLRYIEKHQMDYFSTGISYSEVAFDIRRIFGARGIILSSSNQDLNQGYQTARYVFDKVGKNKIKFVLIGLAPYSFRYENTKAFSVCSRNLQYLLTLNNYEDENHTYDNLISEQLKNYPKTITEESADLNLSAIKNANNKLITTQALVNWEDELKNLTKKFFPDSFKKNVQILEDYIKLCLENGAKPVAVTWAFAPIIHDNYNQELLTHFRNILHMFERAYDFKFIDLFDLNLGYDCFYNTAHQNLKGAYLSSTILNFELYRNDILPVENLCQMTYDQFHLWSDLIDKDSYNNLLEKVFKVTAQKIGLKKKIKVGFVMYDSSMWCGDELYNKFELNDRYETTIYLCLRTDQSNKETVVRDFNHGIEQFKSRGMNVIGVIEGDSKKIDKQDILIYCTPYFEVLPKVLKMESITAETLIVNIPYSFYVSGWDTYNTPINRILWRFFTDLQNTIDTHEKYCRTGMPRGYFSGFTKMDYFFTNKNPNYEWKMTQPNSLKIIYAPHWSIKEGVKYATFQHNHQFFYEYAKNHPNISWVIKPHPNLLFSAVETGVFKSAEEFKEYMNKWNELPNAKVETGGYYYQIFTTSDAMILDSGSFIFEYQYTHKPMLFLTRDTQKFNSLGQELMKVTYRVDGKDLKGIEKFIDDVVINRNDKLFDDRKKFFDEYLNYKKINGMLASEFIFKSIENELIENGGI